MGIKSATTNREVHDLASGVRPSGGRETGGLHVNLSSKTEQASLSAACRSLSASPFR